MILSLYQTGVEDTTGGGYPTGDQVVESIYGTITDFEISLGNFFRVSTTKYTDQTAEAIQALVSNIMSIGIGSELVVNDITSVDRTESDLIKIIKYPYCPISYTKDDEVFVFGEDWQYSGGLMKYNKTGLPETGNDGVVVAELEDSLYLTISITPAYTNSKLLAAESKLFHSDLRIEKINYDSFNIQILLEQLAVDEEEENTDLPIDFKPTSTINSKFAFKLDYAAIGTYTGVSDYDDYLLTTRNNEETILNNAYINYIRTGYNYDKKANALAIQNAQRQAGISTGMTAVQIATAIAGMALAPVTGGVSMIAAATAISSGLSVANT